MTPEEAAEAERACRIARYAALLGFLGLSFNTIADASVVTTSTTQLAAIAVSGTVLAYLWRRRGRPTRALGNGAFLLVNAAALASLWVSSQRLAESNVNWVPFRPHQLGALAVALFAPATTWVGVVTILGFAGAATLQFALFSPELRAHLPFGDPFATLAFGGFAIGLLMFRLRVNKTEREIARMNAELTSVAAFARSMIAMRDLANTPLQTLMFSVDVLRGPNPDPRVIADRIERAATRLLEFERVASRYAHDEQWQPGDESFDPDAVLARER